MIYEGVVEVVCDGCAESEYVDLEYVYFDYSGESGKYDDSNSSIEKTLEGMGWVVVDGKHYCCQDCYEEQSQALSP